MSLPEKMPDDEELIHPKVLGGDDDLTNDMADEQSSDEESEYGDENGEMLPDSDKRPFEGPAETTARRRYFRNRMELALCNTPYKGVLIFSDTEEHQYRGVLDQYEVFMAEYESNAHAWREHYAKIRYSLDKSMGIRPNMTDAELKETLGRVGCITLFGCGFNPTRELSRKLMKGLRKGYARLVLVDFSQKALRSSIDFLSHEGIKPGAAYQMDLTLGSVGNIDNYLNNLVRSSNMGMKYIDENRLMMYLDLINEAVDQLIEQLKANGLVAGTFRGYILKDEDKPGMAVSTMVAAATFMTVFRKLQEIISINARDPRTSAALHEKASQIHAKFNACVVQLITAQMLNFCRDDGSAVMITEIDKINLGLGIDPHALAGNNNEFKDLEEAAARVRKAVEDGGENPALREKLMTVYTVPKISSTGTEVDFEEVVADTPLFDERFKVAISRKKDWFWWDEPLEHGHRVKKISFRAEKIPSHNVLDLIKLVEKDNKDNPDAMEIMFGLLEVCEEPEKLLRNAGISWLRSINPPDFTLPEDARGHKPFALVSMKELIAKVPGEILSLGWEASFDYLQKEQGWMNDNRTRRHVQAGYKLLTDLVGAVNMIEEVK